MEYIGLEYHTTHMHAIINPGDLEWEDLHEGIPASVSRVLDRAGERRVIASTDGGDLLEFDVPPENDVAAGDRGSVIIRRAKIFPAA